jgi:DNA modification methylase
MENTIIHGDALKILQTFPDNSVHCCVTSPPYLWKRDYGVEGQIGLEKSHEEYIEKLVLVFKEVKRVLRGDGSLWMNLGDSYTGSNKGGGGKSAYLQNHLGPGMKSELPSKNLMMIPARVALALQEDGWILRSDIIWQKTTAMPESVQDRPTMDYEHVFLFVKERHYYFDAVAIQQPSISTHASGNGFKRDARLSYLNSDGTARGNDQQWEPTDFRNCRSVWLIPTEPFPGAHFAVMPSKLVERCILAGSSPYICEQCNAPWERIIMKTAHVNKREPAHVPGNSDTKTDSTGWQSMRLTTDEWKSTCQCKNNTGAGKSLILDPFMGVGTTAFVALHYNRQYLGVELNPSYIEMAKERIAIVQPALWLDIPARGIA